LENLNSDKESGKEVLVCMYRTCLKDGSAKVLEAFQANPVPGVKVSGCHCLGLCGSGPIVLVLPEHVYYWHIHPKSVPTLIEQHLRNGKVAIDLLHPRLHPDSQQFI
jgi:(2Fe-2S) ferredoxin